LAPKAPGEHPLHGKASVTAMSVLVTGAAGFIGSHLVERLLSDGEEVVGLDCFDDFYDPSAKERNLAAARAHVSFTEARIDLRDGEALKALPDSVDAVVHLAARAGVRPSIEDPALYTSVNLDGTVSLLEWMRSRRIRDLIFASSSSVYGNRSQVPFSERDPVDRPISPYAATKRAGELLCHTWHHLFGMSIVALRFFTVYGPRQRPDLAIHKFASLLRDGMPIPRFGDGSTERDYTYIADILQGVTGALAFVRSPEPAYEIVNLGESRTVSLQEMIETLAGEMGVEPRIRELPEQPGDVRRTFADVSRARELFGYRPTTEFREGIRRFLEWFGAQR
jgi:UDP-glucuronate 4-epimerase